jgi:hypothetical protein
LGDEDAVVLGQHAQFIDDAVQLGWCCDVGAMNDR